MFELLIWFAAFICFNPTHTAENHGKCKKAHSTTVSTFDDTGGETGSNPKPPSPPPPPPPTGN